MISIEFALPRVAGSLAKLRFAAAVGAAAAVVSCFADAAATFADEPTRTMTAHEVFAAAAVRDPRGGAVAGAPRHGEPPAVVADAGARRKPAGDRPLEPCAAPGAPQYEAAPEGSHDLGDFPKLPVA